MALEDGNQKKVDIFTLIALLLLVLLFAAGQWFTYSSLADIIDLGFTTRVDVPTGSIDRKVDALRDEIRAMKKVMGGAAMPVKPPTEGGSAAPATAAP
ncbi:MAG TPA: hypothetical protein VG389_18920 [Myxococcota bacterium]|jgi:hypothetical protein|nr:hypothetical protein [Myxococcota bacterium]